MIIGSQIIHLSGVNSIDQALAIDQLPGRAHRERTGGARRAFRRRAGRTWSRGRHTWSWWADIMAASPERSGPTLEADPHARRLIAPDSRRGSRRACGWSRGSGSPAGALPDLVLHKPPTRLACRWQHPTTIGWSAVWGFAEIAGGGPAFRWTAAGSCCSMGARGAWRAVAGQVMPQEVLIADERFHHMEATDGYADRTALRTDLVSDWRLALADRYCCAVGRCALASRSELPVIEGAGSRCCRCYFHSMLRPRGSPPYRRGKRARTVTLAVLSVPLSRWSAARADRETAMCATPSEPSRSPHVSMKTW